VTYQIVQAESYWDCIDSLRHDDGYKAQLVDTLSELRRRPFHNPRLNTHDIGSADNGRKLFSSDVGGRASDRRIVWQVFNRTIVVLLYGSHKVQDRAKRMRVDFDAEQQLVEVHDRSGDPDSRTGDHDRAYRERRTETGRLFMAWTDDELVADGMPARAVEHLRRLNTVDELFELGEHLGSDGLEAAFELLAEQQVPAVGAGDGLSESEAGTGESTTAEPAAATAVSEADPPTPPAEAPGAASAAAAPETDPPPGTSTAAEAPEADPPPGTSTATEVTEADPPPVTAEDLELERLLHDEQAGASFTRVEPEFLADVVGRPIEDWMVFLPPDQRGAATRRYRGPGRVRGAAGTGKTVVGLHRAADLALRNRALAARQREESGDETGSVPPVLFTTYIRTLPPVFESLYERLPGTRAGEVEFINVDRLARRICGEAGDRGFINPNKVTKAYDEAFKQTVVADTPLHGGFTPQYLRDEIEKMIKGRAIETLEEYLDLPRTGRRAQLGRLQRTQVWELMERWDAQMARHGTIDFCDVILRALAHARRRPSPTYSAVIVDEAQDLTLAGLQLLRALVNAPAVEEDRPDGLVILGDAAQRIYPGGFTLRQAGVEVRGRTTVLTENYRNTAEIIGAAIAIAGDHRIEDLGENVRRGDEPISTVRSGPRPVLVQINGLDAQTDEIARRIEDLRSSDAGIGPGDVAVLAPFNTSANSVRARLRTHGLDVQSLEDYDGRPNDRVKVGTYHRAKGLEFKAVFLPHMGRFPPRARKGSSTEEAAENRELAVSQLFVAMTRARDLVVVLHGSRLSPVITPAEDHFERIDP